MYHSVKELENQISVLEDLKRNLTMELYKLQYDCTHEWVDAYDTENPHAKIIMKCANCHLYDYDVGEVKYQVNRWG